MTKPLIAGSFLFALLSIPAKGWTGIACAAVAVLLAVAALRRARGVS